MWILLAILLVSGTTACGGDDGGGCPATCGTGFVCDESTGLCVALDAGADGDAPDAPADVPSEIIVEAEVPAEVPPDTPIEDGPFEVVGPCVAAGGTCRGLVAGCAQCVPGEEPAPTTVRCPPGDFCCVPRAATPPLPACLEAGGVCYSISSGSECPPGWWRDDLSCDGPGGCCVPGDGCV